jgi:enamine deaminase RidA (YjgF/YER057c/UK114 family)
MSASLSPFFKTGNLVFISGQVGIDSVTQIIPEGFEE